MSPKSPTRKPQAETRQPLDDYRDPAEFERICARVKDILTSDERIEYAAVQKRLPANPIPARRPDTA